MSTQFHVGQMPRHVTGSESLRMTEAIKESNGDIDKACRIAKVKKSKLRSHAKWLENNFGWKIIQGEESSQRPQVTQLIQTQIIGPESSIHNDRDTIEKTAETIVKKIMESNCETLSSNLSDGGKADDISMVNYELNRFKETMIFNLISSPKSDLSYFERLNVVYGLTSADSVNQPWLADLYMNCGCFSEAIKIYEKLEHWRKLGDLAWILGDLSKAAEYYSNTKQPEELGLIPPRSKDWDRLIKIYFFQSKWSLVIDSFHEADMAPFPENRIVLGSYVTSAKPYLKMVAIALNKAGRSSNDPGLSKKIKNVFSIPIKEWNNLLKTSEELTPEEIKKIQTKCVPRFARVQTITLQEAISKGSTPEARQLFNFFKEIGTHFSTAQECINSFFKTEGSSSLAALFDILSCLPDEESCKTFIPFVLSNSSLYLNKPSPSLIVQFYDSHPLIKRLYFADLLYHKFGNSMRITALDILTGLLQHLSSIETDIKRLNKPIDEEDRKLIDFAKIFSFRDWAEMKIEIWLASEGGELISNAISIWNSGKATPVSTLFDPLQQYPRTPRDMFEWKALIDKCLKWLSDCWYSEVGESQWVSESVLLEIVRDRFKEAKIFRHARPIWLEPQHLDIYIPELSLAIEYMGEQHYKAVDFFGGLEGYEKIVALDKRKVTLCKKAGIELVHIRYNDNFAESVEKLYNHFSHKLQTK